MAGFRNSILAGVNLVRAAIRSPNYAVGTSGWTVNQDGSAEFNSVVIRGGTVVGGTAFYYNGAPGLGKLVMSIAATAGTDPYGNAYTAGVGVYGTADKVTARSTSGDTVTLTADAPSYVSDTVSPGITFRKSTETGDGASITEYDDTFFRGMLLMSPSPVVGGSGGEDFSYIQLDGKFTGGDPQIQLNATGPGSTIGVNGTIFDPLGGIRAYGGPATSFTPALGGDGSATYSNRGGWWIQVGNMIFYNAYFVASGAGSGTTMLSLTTPTEVDRTTRQTLVCHAEGMSGTNSGTATALALTTGSGAVFDRVRNSTGTNLTGANITSSSILSFQGWYRAL